MLFSADQVCFLRLLLQPGVPMAGFDDQFAEFLQKMQEEGLPELAIATFKHHYEKLLRGMTGLIPEKTIVPVEELPNSADFGEELAQIGQGLLGKTVAIKLNGGLGTSMGLEKAKSLLKVKSGLSFLEIIARQALIAKVPLVLMNSFATREDSLKELEKYPRILGELPIDFLQHKVPKIRRDDLKPATSIENPSLGWCPPGHGDLYTALVTSGTLKQLLEKDCRYAFISNADNLGAYIDEAILGHFVSTKSPFLMEVADRTEADSKGGHLARLRDERGPFILREAAQCGEDDWQSFQDIQRYTYFNTNNLWIDLLALHQIMKENDNILRLPMIRNCKTLDPRDPESTPVFQLETAMGAAISIFKGASAVRVPRTRFSPVKTCLDLLAVRSDLTVLTDCYHVQPNPDRTLAAFTGTLDDAFYKNITEMEARFPFGSPSLVNCESLEIRGDFNFGANVVLNGDVKLINESEKQANIPDGAVIEGLLKA
jgi:UTP--glucose-1-phosphate uridylyltransferase